MARETKVGLIAGLAFIICFAIILANRSPSPAGNQRPYLVDRGINAPPSSSISPATQKPAPQRTPRKAGSRMAAASSPVGTAQQTPRRVDRPAGSTAQRSNHAPTTGAAVPLPSFAQPMQPRGTPARRADANRAIPGFEIVPGTGLQHNSSAAERARRLENRLAQVQHKQRAGTGNAIRQTNTSQPPAATGSTQIARRRTPMRVADASTAHMGTTRKSTKIAGAGGSRRYVVLPGDTLTRIAAAQYAADSKSVVGRVVKAVFKSNRSVLASPDVLRVGAEISLPDVDGVRFKRTATGHPNRRSTPSRPEARRANSRKPSTAGTKWYQIKKNDRYVQIAREQLGDAGRWREIYELNKDKFPDPGRIRSGVRIKLPAAFASGAMD